MYRKITFVFFLLLSVVHQNHAEEKKAEEEVVATTLLVTAPPYRFFINELVGNELVVNLVLPAGASPHTYEPSPKQIANLSNGSIWFVVGEPFELRALKALQGFKHSLKVIDLREGISLIYDPHMGCCSAHSSDCADLHYWMSPMTVSLQLDLIADKLTSFFPQLTEQIQANKLSLQAKLKALDEEIKSKLIPGGYEIRTMIVAHPAFAYFGRDYGVRQLSIEQEGKEPSPRQLTDLLRQAEGLKSRYIFALPQYSSKAASLVASQLGATVVTVDPYDENYFEMMRQLASHIAKIDVEKASNPSQ